MVTHEMIRKLQVLCVLTRDLTDESSPSYFLFSHSSIVDSVPFCTSVRCCLCEKQRAYLACDAEVGFICISHLEHPTIVLNEIIINCSFARGLVWVLGQRLNKVGEKKPSNTT